MMMTELNGLTKNEIRKLVFKHSGLNVGHDKLFYPDTNMGDAWILVEWLEEDGINLSLLSASVIWTARFTCTNRTPDGEETEFAGTGQTAPMAICNAYLIAKGVCY